MISKIREYLWRLLGIGYPHMQKVVDMPLLKDDIFTTIGIGTYDNNALVYRWSDAPLVIGSYCSISYGVKFIMDDGKHTNNVVSNYPFKQNIISSRSGITIGNDVWIGLDAVILYGVHIGNGCTIAAGSVVTEDIPDYCVAGGVPAKVIKRKCTVEEAEEMNKIAWWNWNEKKIKDAVPDMKLSISEFIKKYK